MSAVPGVARGPESDEVERYLDALPEGSRCLLLEGEVGIGKTTLLNWARTRAVERGHMVLSATPVELEVPWEFAALADLLAMVPRTAIEGLPDPQRRAIAVAVFRDEPSDGPVDGRTLATAVLRTLRALASDAPVVLAVDDLQWLDVPSARVLSYVLRRAGDAAIGLLGAVRVNWAGDQLPLAAASVDPTRVWRTTIGPMSFREMEALLAERPHGPLGRGDLARVHQLSRGNPLFALELLQENGGTRANHPLSTSDLGVPESLQRLVRSRIRPLSPSARNLLLVGALSAEPSCEVVLAAAEDRSSASELEQVIDAGVVQRQGDDIVFAHPLIRSVVAGDATAEQRRAVHRRLATKVRHSEARARHLALGADGPDEGVALEVEAAATSAAARGACDTAAMLAELSVSLTPSGHTTQRHRRMRLEAENRFEASEPTRACALLEEVVGAMTPGPARAELLRRLARYSAYRGGSPRRRVEMLTTALDEAGDDLALQSAIAFDRATTAGLVGQEVAAIEYSTLALQLAERAGDANLVAQICALLAFHAFRWGEGVKQDLIARGLSGPPQPPRLSMELRPGPNIAHLLHMSDDLDGARVLYEDEYQRASEEGVETGLPMLLWGLVETEAWAGNWARGEELSAEGSELADESGSKAAIAIMSGVRAMLHVYRGRIDEGVRDADLCVSTAASIWFLAAISRGAQALGVAGHSVGDAGFVHQRLGRIADFVLEAGITEPGVLHFLPDEIEALIRLGEHEAAVALLTPFETRSMELGRVWGLATSGRCRGLLLAANGDLPGAEDALDRALLQHGDLGMPFELGRTLMVAGEIRRRARHKRRAQDALESAAAIFAKLGAPLWEQRAHVDLGRLGLRPSASSVPGTDLTEAERAVADLVVSGHTNAEVAARLFMAQRTVEAHLQRVYRKLGVRSRTQLTMVHPPSTT
jgi:DNA-binding CsgD family transcriptional regulator